MTNHRALLVSLATITSVVASVTWQPPSHSQEADLCFGQPATITGSPDVPMVEGTKGPDVIVTNGSTEIAALGGDDLVCVTGAAEALFILLGPGADRMLGSSGDEVVIAADEAPDEIDRDVIDTAGGNDSVYSGGGDKGIGAGQDVIDLGAGADHLVNNGPLGKASLEGGPGRDELALLVKPRGFRHGVPVVFDNRKQEARVDDVAVLRWNSFSDFAFAIRLPVRFTFLGSGAPERLTVQHLGPRWIANVKMRGGHDNVTVDSGHTRMDGGGGADILKNSGAAGTIFGRAGNDHLQGGKADDALIGGKGHDTGRGAGGNDRCATEVRIQCER